VKLRKLGTEKEEGKFFLGSHFSVPFQPSLDVDAHCSCSFHLYYDFRQMCFSAVARSQP